MLIGHVVAFTVQIRTDLADEPPLHSACHTNYFFLGALMLSTSTSSSSKLYSAIESAFVSIFPPYDSRIRDAGTLLCVCSRMRSRSVETSRLSGRSGIVTAVPSSFHSGFVGSLGSSTWSEIVYCGKKKN